MNLETLKLINNPETDDLVAKIDSYLKIKYNKPVMYTPKPGHIPSSFGSKCFRKIYYTYYKVEKDIPTDAYSAKIFETGNYYEDMILSWLIGMGEHIPYRDKEGKVPLHWETKKPNPQFPISVPGWRINKGFIDNVAVSDGKLWLYEIKSSASFKFNELTEPFPEHKVQTAIYVKAFNDHLKNGDFAHIPELAGIMDVSGVKVIYINKDTSRLKVFSLKCEVLDRNIKAVDDKVKKANDYIDLKELPPKTKDKCTYCQFSKKCKKDWNAL